MRQKKSLARANVIGQTLSLLWTVPLYYFYGLNAIVWVLVLSPLIAFCISRYYTYKLKLDTARVTWRETLQIGREMIKLGFFLSLQFLMQQAIVFIIRNFVSARGGVAEVGLYSAGTAIVTTYLGLVFSAIATDYNVSKYWSLSLAAHFWTSDSLDSEKAYRWSLDWYDASIEPVYSNEYQEVVEYAQSEPEIETKQNYYPVRCMKD